MHDVDDVDAAFEPVLVRGGECSYAGIHVAGCAVHHPSGGSAWLPQHRPGLSPHGLLLSAGLPTESMPKQTFWTPLGSSPPPVTHLELEGVEHDVRQAKGGPMLRQLLRQRSFIPGSHFHCRRECVGWGGVHGEAWVGMGHGMATMEMGHGEVTMEMGHGKARVVSSPKPCNSLHIQSLQGHQNPLLLEKGLPTTHRGRGSVPVGAGCPAWPIAAPARPGPFPCRSAAVRRRKASTSWLRTATTPTAGQIESPFSGCGAGARSMGGQGAQR